MSPFKGPYIIQFIIHDNFWEILTNHAILRNSTEFWYTGNRKAIKRVEVRSFGESSQLCVCASQYIHNIILL